ncbi:virion protein US10 [Felid alphaherpesvirus 1]|uniref:Virion protein US10 homolog n=1 Tax=Feline herpesvirus 1 TaxID=10334 RepID=D1FXY3_FHV1|nr:virion protein US10 [Felid alphaherpesvirus 1]YP_003331594.1 virion protein US10 [Felid alphaherpesvirus 1]AMN88996.1 virion protein US10 [synthetic construct]ACT88359.1 virion protein US10 [Felid alphaherpesvirus 1]ACT88363.1 virion protein US10 [Felid alphaherpesvirus 1]ALJ84115.1 virion protein US10 [Felid alphaherpesvirus 1]ALJ84116.1 virion protein US10 [Felid alphaherpesvirus 1]
MNRRWEDTNIESFNMTGVAEMEMYPLRGDSADHAETLPRSVRALFDALRVASCEAFCLMRLGGPPPADIWPGVYRQYREVFRSYSRSMEGSGGSPFHVADPIRHLVGRYLMGLGPAKPESHPELHTRLLYCAYWCCLGHAATCTHSHIYEDACRRFFEEGFGAGEIPPADAVAHWNALYEMVLDEPELLVKHAAAAVYLQRRNYGGCIPNIER